jgi:hypothetical protein
VIESRQGGSFKKCGQSILKLGPSNFSSNQVFLLGSALNLTDIHSYARKFHFTEVLQNKIHRLRNTMPQREVDSNLKNSKDF